MQTFSHGNEVKSIDTFCASMLKYIEKERIERRREHEGQDDARKTEKSVCSRFCCGSSVSFFDVLTFPFAGKSFFLPF